MFSSILRRAVAPVGFALLLAITVCAQTGSVEGTVRITENGVKKGVPNAVIDIYRTDIKGRWNLKADKVGHFVMLGLPLQGTFIFVASGPNIAPAYQSGIRITTMPVVNFDVEAGDGSTLTLDQILAAQKAGGAKPAAPTLSAADRAKAEVSQKEYEQKKKEGEELQASFDSARTHYNAGIELTKATPPNYQAALSEFEQASTVDPGKHAAMLLLSYRAAANLAESHYQIGVELFNQKKRDEAKPHFVKAVEAANRAIAAASTDTPQNNPNLSNDIVIYYNILAKNANLLVQYFGAADLVNPTVKSYDTAASLDAANKNKWGVQKGDLYFGAGRTDEAIAAYKAVLAVDPANIDALYGLGLTLIASTEKAQIQEGANTLADFVAKAPPTDKRVPIVKEALEGVKNAYKVEAEKPAKRGKKP
ncbi:MAG TPA: tetratricopeptide repeat protein [Blastocatellia bacterium]|nr:tetratricopeptide repeat protein [Blastocatellia bacterium]